MSAQVETTMPIIQRRSPEARSSQLMRNWTARRCAYQAHAAIAHVAARNSARYEIQSPETGKKIVPAACRQRNVTANGTVNRSSDQRLDTSSSCEKVVCLDRYMTFRGLPSLFRGKAVSHQKGFPRKR